MHLRDATHLMGEWLQGSFFLVVGVAGVLLILLGLRREDAARPVFLLAGLGLVGLGFGVHFLGWSF